MIQMFSRVAQRIGPAAQGTKFGLCFLLCLIGCATAKANSPNSSESPSHRADASSSETAPASSSGIDVAHHARWDFQEFAGERTPVLVGLPKVGQWQFDDQKTTWWVATNSSLGMRIEAKLWPERRLVTWQDCLVDLGRWRAISPMVSNTLESKDVNLPVGFSSHLSVHIDDRNPVRSRTATVMLVGSDVSRCVALWTQVQVPGASNDDELLARVALITEGIFPKFRLRSVEQRVDTKVDH